MRRSEVTRYELAQQYATWLLYLRTGIEAVMKLSTSSNPVMVADVAGKFAMLIRALRVWMSLHRHP